MSMRGEGYIPGNRQEQEGDVQRTPLLLKERIRLFKEDLKAHLPPTTMAARLDLLIEDTRKDATRILTKFGLPIINKNPMRTTDELKSEIFELENIATGITSEIEVMNSKNVNAQKRRDMVRSKIDGLKWMLNEKEETDHA